jgi:phosphatidylethanolamine-binding protein (PEBP) family uncharacterized protein
MRLAKAIRTGSFLLPVLALAAVLLLAGCGDDGEDSGTAATGASAESAESDGNADTNNGEAQSDGEGQASNGSQPEGEREPDITPEQRRKGTTADIKLEIPGYPGGGAPLPARYTCDGADESPPLRWSNLPPEAEELVLLVLGSQPVNEKLFFNWAVAGLDPELEEIEEGEMPSDAIQGENGFGKEGYSICPSKGQRENYVFMLYAIPEALSPEAGFDPLALREEVLDQAGNVGFLIAPYTRR